MAGLQGETITGVEVDGVPTSGPPIGGDNIAAPDKVTSGLADIQREGSAAKEGLYGNIAHLANQDAFRAHHAYDAEAATSHDIPTWDEEAQKQKFSTDPVKAFGSVGSVFAMIAAAFTHRPMINALQGSAAAMDAIKAGDDKAYDQAFTAYKTNADLAIKRHQMMHEEYQDAVSLMNTDMAAGEAQLKLAAMKYDDKQMLFLTENGLSDLRDKLMTGRAKAIESTVEANDKIDAQSLRRQTFDSMKRDVEKSGIPKDDPRYAALMAEAGRRAFAGKETPIDPQMWQWEMQHAQDHDGKGPTAEERQKFYKEFQARYGSVLANQREELFQELEAAKDAGDTEGANRIQQKINDLKSATSTTGNQRIDQSIVNQLPNYPHLTQNDLGYIAPAQQVKLASAFISAQNLERIAAYARDNPEAIGLIADASKRMNLDAYQSWFGSDGGATEELKNKTEADRDNAIDASAKDQGLSMTQAAKAKILSKMLTTQAFADAASAGARGGTIFLDRAFKEIYQQASSPGAFFGILQKRYEDSNVVASQYKMGFNDRSDKQNMPFWDQGPEGFVHRADAANKGLQVRDVVEGKDGKKYKYNGGPADDKNSYMEVPADTPVTKHGR